MKPWQTPGAQDLLCRRRHATGNERKTLNKHLQRKFRRQNRKFMTEKTEGILKCFENLKCLHHLHRLPIQHVEDTNCNGED